jgi:hypothetical protein
MSVSSQSKIRRAWLMLGEGGSLPKLEDEVHRTRPLPEAVLHSDDERGRSTPQSWILKPSFAA